MPPLHTSHSLAQQCGTDRISHWTGVMNAATTHISYSVVQVRRGHSCARPRGVMNAAATNFRCLYFIMMREN
ncbi:MAG: hypothetical protein M3Z24_15720 [Chloroflexota bacterium]|nr:hypothetical protein [Chloroflexota bacterium]